MAGNQNSWTQQLPGGSGWYPEQTGEWVWNEFGRGPNLNETGWTRTNPPQAGNAEQGPISQFLREEGGIAPNQSHPNMRERPMDRAQAPQYPWQQQLGYDGGMRRAEPTDMPYQKSGREGQGKNHVPEKITQPPILFEQTIANQKTKIRNQEAIHHMQNAGGNQKCTMNQMGAEQTMAWEPAYSRQKPNEIQNRPLAELTDTETESVTDRVSRNRHPVMAKSQVADVQEANQQIDRILQLLGERRETRRTARS